MQRKADYEEQERYPELLLQIQDIEAQSVNQSWLWIHRSFSNVNGESKIE